MFLVKVHVVFAVVAAVISLSACSPVHETNAERMARGLPPSPPKFGRTLPGHIEARESTPVLAAKRAYPSQTPPISYAGRIEARNKDGSVLGIVRNSASSWTIGGLNALGPEQDLHVSFTTHHSGKGPFNILATNPAFPAPFYVGASGSATSDSIDLNSRNTVAFSNVQETPAYSIPLPSSFDDNLVESSIWSINPGTNELEAQYINPDGSKPATIIAYDIRANALFFVGDIDAYNENNDTPASAIRLFLVPI